MLNNIPDVHAGDRDIPAGKVLIAEYGQVPADAPRARPMLLDQAPGQFGRMIRLEAIPAGWAIAGSMLRWDNGCYAVRFEDRNGSIHGQRFSDFDKAHALFVKWTA